MNSGQAWPAALFCPRQSHHPTRRQERYQQGFKRRKRAQEFLHLHARIGGQASLWEGVACSRASVHDDSCSAQDRTSTIIPSPVSARTRRNNQRQAFQTWSYGFRLIPCCLRNQSDQREQEKVRILRYGGTPGAFTGVPEFGGIRMSSGQGSGDISSDVVPRKRDRRVVASIPWPPR